VSLYHLQKARPDMLGAGGEVKNGARKLSERSGFPVNDSLQGAARPFPVVFNV
jgi:hypothetical protein